MGIELVIVRHGRTAWNREVRFRGRMDLPLDEVGLQQAEAAARAVSARWPSLSAVYASPLQRAVQTATPIATRYGLAVQLHDALLDIDYGEWTGRTPQEVEASDPERFRLWLTAPHEIVFPGGDSLPMLQERLRRFLHELEQRHAGETVALVSHQLVNRVLLATLLGLPLAFYARLGQDNACLNLARYDAGVGEVLLLNETCHLNV
ncbi:MAG: histidine phosphatase family protein [Chloroflexia bacterium]